MPRNVDPSVKKGVGLKQLVILHAVEMHKKPTISSRSNLWQNSSATKGLTKLISETNHVAGLARPSSRSRTGLRPVTPPIERESVEGLAS